MQNVKFVRNDIDGESHVLLVACRDIACGEKLYCDCLMTLLVTADPSQMLVICPDKCGNIYRFMSGINNHTP